MSREKSSASTYGSVSQNTQLSGTLVWPSFPLLDPLSFLTLSFVYLLSLLSHSLYLLDTLSLSFSFLTFERGGALAKCGRPVLETSRPR